jgi:cell division septal protein FtsQ
MKEVYLSKDKKRNDLWKTAKIFLIGLILEGFFILILYLIIYSPVFKINDVQIINNENISSEDVLNFIKINIFNNSYFKKILGFQNILIWPNFLENNYNTLAQIKNISIEKDYFKKNILVKIEERKPIGLWCVNTESKCFEFDDNGYLFNKTFFSEGGTTLKIFDFTSRKLSIGAFVLEKRLFDNLNLILKVLEKNNLNIEEIDLKNLETEEIAVKLFNGPYIYFSLNFPPPDLESIINKINNFNNLKYLDLRVENRVYYK